MSLQTHVLDKSETYDGSQLRPRYIYETTGLLGDAMLVFCGPCHVDLSHLVDLEDVRRAAPIKSNNMIHVLLELFHVPLIAGIAIQRLLVDHAKQAFEDLGVNTVSRHGDDLFDGLYKLSVSIAAPSILSTLIHFGINISSQGTPIPTRGLEDYNISPDTLIERMTQSFSREYSSIQRASYKVKEL